MGAAVAHHRSAPGLWSLSALVLAGPGVVAATWLAASADSDPTHVLWPLVAAPVVIASIPVLLPRAGTRLGAMLTLGLWCMLTGFSIGLLLVPSLAALVGASVWESQ